MDRPLRALIVKGGKKGSYRRKGSKKGRETWVDNVTKDKPRILVVIVAFCVRQGPHCCPSVHAKERGCVSVWGVPFLFFFSLNEGLAGGPAYLFTPYLSFVFWNINKIVIGPSFAAFLRRRRLFRLVRGSTGSAALQKGWAGRRRHWKKSGC